MLDSRAKVSPQLLFLGKSKQRTIDLVKFLPQAVKKKKKKVDLTIYF